MLNYLVTFRRASDGEMLPFKIRAWAKRDAIEAGVACLAERFTNFVERDAWELHSVNRTDP